VSNLSHETLMRYYDGELPEAEARDVETTLASDTEARRVLEGLEQIGAVVRGLALDRAEPHGDLADRILERIEAEKVEPAPAPGGPSAEVVRPARWQRVVPAIAGALAVAASIALVVELTREEAPSAPSGQAVRAPAPVLGTPASPASPALEPETPVAEADVTPAVSIETVDFGGHQGTIFMLQEGAASTPVVWLVDEPSPRGTRMEPL
jgi:negative regulator of sigma E activity